MSSSKTIRVKPCQKLDALIRSVASASIGPRRREEREKSRIIEQSVAGQITFPSRDTLNIRRDYANTGPPDRKLFRGTRLSEFHILSSLQADVLARYGNDRKRRESLTFRDSPITRTFRSENQFEAMIYGTRVSPFPRREPSADDGRTATEQATSLCDDSAVPTDTHRQKEEIESPAVHLRRLFAAADCRSDFPLALGSDAFLSR